MTLSESKKLIVWAQKRGIKSLKFGDIEVQFTDAVVFPRRKPRANPNEPKLPEPEQVPTLDQINRFIYEDEAG